MDVRNKRFCSRDRDKQKQYMKRETVRESTASDGYSSKYQEPRSDCRKGREKQYKRASSTGRGARILVRASCTTFSERSRLGKTATRPAEFSSPHRRTSMYFIII